MEFSWNKTFSDMTCEYHLDLEYIFIPSWPTAFEILMLQWPNLEIIHFRLYRNAWFLNPLIQYLKTLSFYYQTIPVGQDGCWLNSYQKMFYFMKIPLHLLFHSQSWGTVEIYGSIINLRLILDSLNVSAK